MDRVIAEKRGGGDDQRGDVRENGSKRLKQEDEKKSKAEIEKKSPVLKTMNVRKTG